MNEMIHVSHSLISSKISLYAVWKFLTNLPEKYGLTCTYRIFFHIKENVNLEKNWKSKEVILISFKKSESSKYKLLKIINHGFLLKEKERGGRMRRKRVKEKKRRREKKRGKQKKMKRERKTIAQW